MTGKTLKELNVQVGDVVEYTFGGKSYPERYGPVDDGWTTLAYSWDEADNPNWVIISRATKYTDWKFGTVPDGADTHVMPDGSVAWRIKVEPMVERVVLFGRTDEYSPHVVSTDTHRITYTTIDGVPDCASVKMEVL